MDRRSFIISHPPDIVDCAFGGRSRGRNLSASTRSIIRRLSSNQFEFHSLTLQGVDIVVLIAQNTTLAATCNVHDVANRNVRSAYPDRDRKLQRHVAAFDVVVVHHEDGAGDIGQAGVKVQLLPRPPDAIEIGMMKIKDWIRRRNIEVANLSCLESARLARLSLNGKHDTNHRCLPLRSGRHREHRTPRSWDRPQRYGQTTQNRARPASAGSGSWPGIGQRSTD